MRTPLTATGRSAGPDMGIEQCGDCGLLHLHIGAVTLRLTAGTLAELHAILDHALGLRHSSLPVPVPDATGH